MNPEEATRRYIRLIADADDLLKEAGEDTMGKPAYRGKVLEIIHQAYQEGLNNDGAILTFNAARAVQIYCQRNS